MKKSTMEEKVKDILARFPKTRNDDVSLTLQYINQYHEFDSDGNKSIVKMGDAWYVSTKAIRHIREDHIKRVRAKIQNDQGLYLPTDPAVRMKRKISEAEWLSYTSNHIDSTAEIQPFSKFFFMRMSVNDLRKLREKGVQVHGDLPKEVQSDLDNPLEDFESESFSCWLRANLVEEGQGKGILEYSHIPHETYTPFKNVRNKLKRMGVRKGFPDFFIIIQDRKNVAQAVAVEMKRKKKSSTSDEQKTWIKFLQLARIPSRVCKGHEEAITFISSLF